MPEAARKYLIVGPSWVGDMVMAQSLFLDLKTRYPAARIDVLAPKWSAALIDRMPQIDRLVAVNFTHGKLSLGERWRLGKALRNAGYTHAIVLPNSIKAALVPALAKIPQRTGFLGEQRWGLLTDIRKLNKQTLPMTVQRFVALGRDKSAPAPPARELPIPALHSNSEQTAATMTTLGLTAEPKVLALCPGAEFGASKKWPAVHYAELAQHYLAQGWQVWLLGSDSDIRSCTEINQQIGNQAKVLAGLTSLPQAIDLLAQAALVVSNDSGLMHIAAGLQIPLVAVYGSTDPGHTPPLSSNHRIAQLSIECAPCFKRDCPLQHHNCMQQLSADTVIALSTELLQ